MEQVPGFLKKLKEKDADYATHLQAIMEKEQKDTALPAKVKALIIMALDAAHGDRKGVEMLADRARRAGASEQEIVETVELVGNTCGIQGLIVALNGLKE